MALLGQLHRQITCALGRPPQGTLRITQGVWLQQTVESVDELGVAVRSCLTSSTWSALKPLRKRAADLHFPESAPNRRLRKTSRFGNRCRTTPTQRSGFHGGPSATTTLRQRISEVG